MHFASEPYQRSGPENGDPPATRRVTLIAGDGVGPEVVRSARRIIHAAGVAIEWEEAEAGAEVFRRGDTSGVPRETRESIERTRVALKGPLETPVGYGEKSANVTLRKLFETYANVRPCRELPGVPTRYAGEGIDLVIVRENMEDLYAGIEHLQTPDVAQCLKIITRRGSEKVIRYAFELARREGRRRVTAATKANIMKLTEGLFKRVHEELAAEYREVEADHLIIDNVAHQLVKDPSQFDVIVTTNLNGDIISDLASGLVGGLGFASSGNYGDEVAIFEAVHGSAPKYAGRDVINPTALILSSVLMLRHIGEVAAADGIEDAVLVTLEEGQAVTQDLARLGGDVEAATSTTGYTDAVISNLGRHPSAGSVRSSGRIPAGTIEPRPMSERGAGRGESGERRLVGADVFLDSDASVDELGPALERLASDSLTLSMISSRGTKVYPSTGLRADDIGWYQCRFLTPGADDASSTGVGERELLELVGRISDGHRVTQVEMLQTFGQEPGYTRAQGE